jgi:NAD-specific glutamate dehydrogenase
VFFAHRVLTMQVLKAEGKAARPWESWLAAHEARVQGVLRTIGELLAEKPFDLAKLSVAQGLLWDLATTQSASRP